MLNIYLKLKHSINLTTKNNVFNLNSLHRHLRNSTLLTKQMFNLYRYLNQKPPRGLSVNHTLNTLSIRKSY